MPIIINEFEVLVEAPQQSASEASPGNQPPPRDQQPALTVEDVVQIEDMLRERQLRVHAD